MKNSTPKLSFFQSAFYVYLPECKPPRTYVVAGTPEQIALYRQKGAKAVKATPEQDLAHAEFMIARKTALTVGNLAAAPEAERLFKFAAESFLKINSAEGAVDHSARLKDFMEWKNAGELPLSKITPLLVREWIAERSDRWFSASARNKARLAVKGVMAFATTENWVAKNCLAGKALPMEAFQKQKEYLISVADEAVIAGYTSPAFNAFFRFALLTGARPSEIARITADDIFEEDGYLSVKLHEHKNAKKTGTVRVIPVGLFDEADKILRAALKANPEGYVFRGPNGDDFNQGSWIKTFNRLNAKGLVSDGFTFYATKHAAITRMARAGIPLADIAAWTGTSLEMIEKHYGEFTQLKKDLKARYREILNAKQIAG
jgi:integrase